MMSKQKKYLVLGGDKRLTYLARLFKEQQHNVLCYWYSCQVFTS